MPEVQVAEGMVTPEQVDMAIEKVRRALESCKPEDLRTVQGQLNALRWVRCTESLIIG